MITEIKTKQELAALEAAVNEAARVALKYKDADDGGACNFDTPLLAVKIPKRLRDATALHLARCWGRYSKCYIIEDIPLYGQGDRRSEMAEAACESLRTSGYAATMYYQMD